MKTCSIDRCGESVVARGLCQKHYNDARYEQVKNGSWVSHVAPMCSVEGCEGKHLAGGMCQKHYSQAVRQRNRDFIRKRYFKDGVKCGRCGKEKDMVQMDAHHPDPSAKEHALSMVLNNSALQRRPELLAELDACEMMCTRCHQNLHHNPVQTHEETYARKDKGRRVDEMKARIRAEFGESCSVCRDWMYPKEMEFHHRDRSMKAGNVADMVLTASWEEVRAEVAKCVIVCRNCHRLFLERAGMLELVEKVA